MRIKAFEEREIENVAMGVQKQLGEKTLRKLACDFISMKNLLYEAVGMTGSCACEDEFVCIGCRIEHFL